MMTADLPEKPVVDQATTEEVVEHHSVKSSLKEKDAEAAVPASVPQNDEESNVTLKTWCVVIVSVFLPILRRSNMLTQDGFSPCPMVSASGLSLRSPPARLSFLLSLETPGLKRSTFPFTR